jgi:hypothetical protein
MTTDLARTDDAQRGLAVADREEAAGALAHILATGDLSKLSNEQRVAHYLDLCQSLSLNPRSRPFDWLVLDSKLVLYPNKSCAEQLRRAHQISVHVTRREPIGLNSDEPMFVVEVEGRTPSGRTDESTKYVPLTAYNKQGQKYRLSGANLTNAYAKAETGAKRRLVLSMVGLASPPDPEEVRGARFVTVDGTGHVLDNPTQEQKALAENPAMARVIGEPVYEDAEGQEAPLAGTPDQRVTQADVTPPRPAQGPPASFKNSDEQIAEWRRTWFATVKGLSLDTDAARAAFVRQWTADEWPKAKRTDSLATFFARATPAEAEDLLAHVRAIMDDERRELLAQSYENMPDQESSRPDVDRRVHDAVMVTGGPAVADDAPGRLGGILGARLVPVRSHHAAAAGSVQPRDSRGGDP